MGGDVERADLVVEEASHGEPVERLVAAAADAAVVHVRRDGDAQAFLAASGKIERRETRVGVVDIDFILNIYALLRIF